MSDATPTASKRLNLGSAGRPVDGYLNVDWNEIAKPDFMHDLNAMPYPFEDSSVEEVRAFHILEHLERPFDVMREIHRILEPGGLLHIKVPHCSRGFTHTEHARGFDVSFPLYFNPEFYEAGYFGVHFKLEYMKLRWLGNVHLLKHIGIGSGRLACLQAVDTVITGAAALNPYVCSRIWCFWVGGFDEIEFRFRCVK